MLIVLSSCSTSIRFSSTADRTKSSNSSGAKQNSEPVAPGTVITGKASYYGDEFQGRMTSNGEIYERNKLSAAHKTFPFGTTLRVRNLSNNREVIVRVNDRGPFVAGRILDLSYQAAKELDMIRDGVADVEIIVLK